jgi:hypothetical protein
LIYPNGTRAEKFLPDLLMVRNDNRGMIRQCDLYKALLASLLGRLGDKPGKNTIITFNYDLLVEEALTALTLKTSYRLSQTEQPDGVPLLKLHGSLNWIERQGTIDAVGSYDDVRAQSEAPALIPPTWKKTFPRSMASIWGHAATALRTATRIIVIGFSLPETDLHFKYLLASGLAGNISLRKIAFVGPDVGKPEYKQRLDSIDYCSSNQRCPLFACQLHSNPLPPPVPIKPAWGGLRASK